MRFAAVLFLFFLSFEVWADNTLVVAHTNDLHAHLVPFRSDGQECMENDTSFDCRGGYARLKGLIDQWRQDVPDLVFLDAGDRFSGTPFYTLRKGQDIARLTEQLGYDALALGNHDFDDGLEELTSFLKTVSAPVLAANVTFPDTSPLKKRVTSSVVLTRGQVKIGLIGVLSEETKTECAGAGDIDLTDVTQAVRREVMHFKQQGINVIFALTHIGLKADQALARAVPELDVIIGGHSHSFLSNDSDDKTAEGPYPIAVVSKTGDKTLIVTAGMGGRVVGRLDVTFDDDGRIIAFKGDSVPVDMNISPDTAFQSDIAAVSQILEQTLDQSLAVTSQNVSLTPNKSFCGESCPVGEVLSDALLSAAKAFGADVAILNAGGVRAALPAGEITYRHLIQAYPFNSSAVIVEMNGQALNAFVTHGLKKYTPGARTNAFILPAGFSYTFNPDTRQIIRINIQGQPVDPGKIYRVAMPSFLADGGDGFPVQREQTVFAPDIREVMGRALQGVVSFNRFENRISVTRP